MIPAHPHPFAMHHSAATPIQFSGQASWIEKYGFCVWEQLCDRCRLDTWYATAVVAEELPFLQLYRSRRARYLRAVLKAVVADFAERPDVYEGKCPVVYQGARFKLI